jgi:hypothetical protein
VQADSFRSLSCRSVRWRTAGKLGTDGTFPSFSDECLVNDQSVPSFFRADLCRRLGPIPEARAPYEKELALARQESGPTTAAPMHPVFHLLCPSQKTWISYPSRSRLAKSALTACRPFRRALSCSSRFVGCTSGRDATPVTEVRVRESGNDIRRTYKP